MKSPFLNSRIPAIGLHLGPRFATLVQVAGSAQRCGLMALAQGLLPVRGEETDDQYDELVAATLKLMVSDHGFRGHLVVSCVPADELHLQSVRLPQLPPDEMQKAVRLEAQE